MIRCLAIDDEPLALRQLVSYLQKVPYFEVVGSCHSALEAARVLEETEPDTLFVDINMPDLNGLDFVRSLRQRPLVVFTTAYSEYAVEGYKVDAVDYLLKPFGMADIMAAAERVKRQYELMHADNVSPVDADEAIFIKTDNKVQRVLLGDIVSIEGMGEYLRIHIAGLTKPAVVLMSLKKMEERLAEHRFMRVHKSFIINLSHIKEIARPRVIMDDGSEVPIGESYRAALADYIAGRFLV